MDVEGALALDLAELEAMLAIDSEQVLYDEQVKVILLVNGFFILLLNSVTD